MKFPLVLCLSLLAFVAGDEVEQEEGVYVLTDSNFDDFIDVNEFVLVEFCKYKNWWFDISIDWRTWFVSGRQSGPLKSSIAKTPFLRKPKLLIN